MLKKIVEKWFIKRNKVHFSIKWKIVLIEKKENKEKQKTVTMKNEVYTTFLVTCVGYHDDSYKQIMLGLYTHFS